MLETKKRGKNNDKRIFLYKLLNIHSITIINNNIADEPQFVFGEHFVYGIDEDCE